MRLQPASLQAHSGYVLAMRRGQYKHPPNASIRSCCGDFAITPDLRIPYISLGFAKISVALFRDRLCHADCHEYSEAAGGSCNR